MSPSWPSCARRYGTFCAPTVPSSAGQPTVDSWLGGWDPEFSARLGDAGFVGLTIPHRYGGHGLGHLHRYVVTEELLVHGAPVAAHWIADRQVAPGLLAYGNEEQRQRLLPRIAAGRFYSSIGMSEHGAGSDLAAVQTKATEDGGRLAAERHQGVDQRRASRASGRRAGPHQPARSRASTCRVQSVPGADATPTACGSIRSC